MVTSAISYIFFPELCREVQRLYESQFIDNETTFEYVGFPTQTQQDAFWAQLSRLTQCLAEANEAGHYDAQPKHP